MAAARVIGTVSSHSAEALAFRYLVQQLRQNWTVAIAAGGEFHGADVRRGRVHGQMDLAPLATTLNAMLARLPLAIAQKLDPGAVHEQVERAIGTAIRDMDGECLLPSAQGRIIRHGPVQVRHLQQAGHHPASPWSLGPVAFSWLDLPQRQHEQDLDRQAELDRGIGEHRRATGAAVMRRRRRHAVLLTAWIHHVNPPKSELCNNAA